MNKEYLQLLGNKIRYKKEYIKDDLYRLYIKKNEIEFLEKELQRLGQIDNTKPSEALKWLNRFKGIELSAMPFKSEDGATKEVNLNEVRIVGSPLNNDYRKFVNTIEQTLIKSQETEKENELLKEIIKILFDEGCPLHQYNDDRLGLTIEVDDNCSIINLGEFKGVDLNKFLKEVLDNE